MRVGGSQRFGTVGPPPTEGFSGPPRPIPPPSDGPIGGSGAGRTTDCDCSGIVLDDDIIDFAPPEFVMDEPMPDEGEIPIWPPPPLVLDN